MHFAFCILLLLLLAACHTTPTGTPTTAPRASGPILQKASQPDTDGGTNDSRYITPLKLANRTGGGSGGSTNNVTLTGQNVISTNLLVRGGGSKALGKTNTFEVQNQDGTKTFEVGTNGQPRFAIKTLLKSNGDTVLDFENGALYGGGNPVFDLESGLLSPPSGAAYGLSLNAYMLHAATGDSLGWSDRIAYDIAGNAALNWQNKTTAGGWAFTGNSGAFSNSVTASNAVFGTTAAISPTNIVESVSIGGLKIFRVGTNMYVYAGTNVSSPTFQITDQGTVVVGTNTYLGPTNAAAVASGTFLKLDGTPVATTSRVIDWQVGNISYFSVLSNGVITLGPLGFTIKEQAGILQLSVEGNVTSNTTNWLSSRFGTSANKMFFGDDGTTTHLQAGHQLRIFAGNGGTPNTNKIGHLTVSTAGDVGVTGSLTATNGLASLSTVAAFSIATTGVTNIWQTNMMCVRFDATLADLAWYVKNNAGTSTYTNAGLAVSHAFEILQPGGAVVISAGTGVTGRAAPL